MATPRTRYARNGAVSIAYQVVGDGPDLLWTPGFISHLDVFWADPDIARFMRRLSAFSRLIVYDKRGTGMSDPVVAPPTLEDRVGDLAAVLDAAGSERATILGFSEGATAGFLYAASAPSRVSAVIAYGAIILGVAHAERPWGVREETYSQLLAAVDRWGEGETLGVFAPSIVPGGIHQRVWGAIERSCASPAMARALVEAWREADITGVLSTLRLPVVAIHRRQDQFPVEAARYIAEHVASGRIVELEGEDHLPWIGDTQSILGEIEQTVTGQRSAVDPTRALTTIMFTDIVASTARAAELGDSAWRALLERHGRLVRDEVTTGGGQIISSTGDGFLIVFDGVPSAVTCARRLTDAVRELGLEIRAGIHCGECEHMDEGLAGVAVHIGARVCALAGPGEVLVTKVAADLAAGAGLRFAERGRHRLKGVPDEWQLFGALPGDDESARNASQPVEGWYQPRDRAFVALARHLPSAIRLGGRITRRRRAAHPGDER